MCVCACEGSVYLALQIFCTMSIPFRFAMWLRWFDVVSLT